MKPNILLVVIDCLRSDRTFGQSRSAVTPNLNTLAEKGTLFPNLITANSMTIPCMTSMFSGLYPQHHGVRAMVGARVSDETPLLAEIMQRNGYATYAEASGPLNPFYKLDRGFDHYEQRDGVKSSLLGQWGDELITRFNNNEFTEPWFVYLHLWGVHRPRQILPQYNSPEYGQTEYDRAISSYDDRLGDLLEAIDLDKTVVLVTGDHGEKIPESGLENQVEFFKKALSTSGKPKKKTVWTKRRRKAIASIRETWFSTTRTLHKYGLVDSPLASMTGHGYHVYDTLVRVPLVVTGYPNSNAGQLIDDQVRQIDLMPTILDLAGLSNEIPETADGRSLQPLMNDTTLEEKPAFIETCQNSREPSSFYGVRFQDWKYAYDADDASVPEELYDLAVDATETNNIAATNPARTAEMRALIESYLQLGQNQGIALSEDLTEAELTGLSEHLKKLGYVD